MDDEFNIDVIDDGYPSHLEIGGEGDGQSFGVEVGGEGQSFGEEIGGGEAEAEAVQMGIYRTLAKARDNRRSAPPMRAVAPDAPRRHHPGDASLIGICGGSGEELYPLTATLLKQFGESGEPRIVRVDSVESYKQFRLRDSPEMSAFKERVADVERKLDAHLADPEAHSSAPPALEAELEELHQIGAEVAQIEQAKQVPLRMPKHFDGLIGAWHEDGLVGASLIIPGADGSPRICTSMEPIQNGVLEAAKAATEAGVPAAQIVGFLPAIGAALSAATAIKETAAGVESVLKRPEARRASPFLVRLEPQTSPAIFTLAALAWMCGTGNQQACDEWQRLAAVAPPVVKQAMVEVCQALKAQQNTTVGETKNDGWLGHMWTKILAFFGLHEQAARGAAPDRPADSAPKALPAQAAEVAVQVAKKVAEAPTATSKLGWY